MTNSKDKYDIKSFIFVKYNCEYLPYFSSIINDKNSL